MPITNLKTCLPLTALSCGAAIPIPPLVTRPATDGPLNRGDFKALVRGGLARRNGARLRGIERDSCAQTEPGSISFGPAGPVLILRIHLYLYLALELSSHPVSDPTLVVEPKPQLCF